ncbi:GntR family transcriptional regulator [Devosia sp.]|jgi:DNA-binding GntR family transcriptional regulator|uniref:GntR family transcriptional regulator n=1 Tax=Devosia sp. TaxID=1871048 RepID=UPI0019FDB582|nr:GntR family transcriptional regulator [Devosia sp.]MBE0578726.1 GntR family transcriptional regulator [Devosia sp.]
MKQVQDLDANAEPVPLSAVEILVQDLRRRILSGDFRPGEFLRDARMCHEHSTSRHTYRTAAQALVTQGLLRQIPNRGFMLPEFGPDDIVDITRVRGAIEGEAIRLIVLTGVIPPMALEAVQVMHTSTLSSNKSALVTADRDFHRAIVAASGSTRLMRTYSGLEGEIELLLVQRQDFYGTAEEMASEHERLISSLRSRHYETARVAFTEHWADLQIKLLDPR